jgi:hypothetical protein
MISQSRNKFSHNKVFVEFTTAKKRTCRALLSSTKNHCQHEERRRRRFLLYVCSKAAKRRSRPTLTVGITPAFGSPLPPSGLVFATRAPTAGTPTTSKAEDRDLNPNPKHRSDARNLQLKRRGKSESLNFLRKFGRS